VYVGPIRLASKAGGHSMETKRPTQSRLLGETPSGSFRELLTDAIRFWEPRRLIYNFVLSAIVVAWIVLTWPHFRVALTWSSLLILTCLGLIANACYCAAYLVDIPMQRTSLRTSWQRKRWGLWSFGMLFAIVLTNYWIVDEIYPYVR